MFRLLLRCALQGLAVAPPLIWRLFARCLIIEHALQLSQLPSVSFLCWLVCSAILFLALCNLPSLLGTSHEQPSKAPGDRLFLWDMLAARVGGYFLAVSVFFENVIDG